MGRFEGGARGLRGRRGGGWMLGLGGLGGGKGLGWRGM